MQEPFLGTVVPYAFNFAPKNWAFANGQLLSIQQNAALFSLLGTSYGGNGVQTFALPNLQSRVPIGMGQLPGGRNYSIGEMAGSETVTINANQMPQHTHLVPASTAAGSSIQPAGVLASGGSTNAYGTPNAAVAMSGEVTSVVGGNQPHTNLQPSLAINFCVALQGIFPSRN